MLFRSEYAAICGITEEEIGENFKPELERMAEVNEWTLQQTHDNLKDYYRLKGDLCKTLMLEVIVEDTAAEKHLAYVQEVMVKPQSYGGDTSGLNIPFNVSEDGKRTKGYVTAESVKTGNPKFTEGEITA